MPLYEYQCEACGGRFEVIQRFSDPPVEVCQTCGGHVRKLLSAPAIQFKGSGWYVTDYARKGMTAGETGAPAKSDEKAKPSSDAKATPASSSSTTPGSTSSGS
jgi:putative FmdB family regulatory protein